MENTIIEFMNNNKLCEIYADVDNTSKFGVGYIIACSGDYTVAEMYDPNGHYDGISCFLTDAIFDVATDTEYLSALNKLINHHKEKCDYAVEAIDEINKILNIVKSEKRICEIELCESGTVDAVGYIEAFNDNTLKLCNVDKYGKNDGRAIVRRDTISCISFDSKETVKLEILRK